MKKGKHGSSTQSSNSRTIFAATILGLPLSVLPSIVQAQGATPPPAAAPVPTSVKSGVVLKMPTSFLMKAGKGVTHNTIVGVNGDGHSVYRNAAGEYFYLDPKTADLHFLSSQETAAFQRAKAIGWKSTQEVTILGIDADGHTLQKNSRGETFYLDAKGDMVFVK